MTSAVLTPSSAPRRVAVRQLPTHAHLYSDTPIPLAGRTRRDVPDAIVVPAGRPASAQEHLIDLAAHLGTEIVFLCSGQAAVDQVVERMRRRIGCRGLAARIDGSYALPLRAALGTSDTRFETANGGRRSDLSTKRNVGLLLARYRGWGKILFVDDDITITSPADVARIARLLDRFPIAGMHCREHPDNSVVCHARRLAKLSQDVFLSGAVLGVNCRGRDLAFFPDIYNEDWFFFGNAAAARRLPKPREARQARYDPYGNPRRARHEEFGDLLAEGLFALIGSSGLGSFDDVVVRATEAYWADFIQVRLEGIESTSARLTRFLDRDDCSDEVPAAIASLDASRWQYEGAAPAITPDTCLEFLDAWRKDVAEWGNALPEPRRLSTADAMDRLGVTDWRPVA